MNKQNLLAAFTPLLVAACTDELPPPQGPHYQYVVSELHVPATQTEARQYALDLNGDDAPDNQLGAIFATLNSMGLGVGDTAREALLRGGLIMLADLQTPDFDNTESSGVMMYLGRDPVPDACVDPASLETCGQHLLGTGQFALDGEYGFSSSPGVAPIIDGRFDAPMNRLPVKIAIVDPASPIRVNLHGARVRLAGISPEYASAVLAGGITKADVNAVVIPEAAAQMDRIVVAECNPTIAYPTCGCSERAKRLIGLFDANYDCRITTSELADNSLVRALLWPDVSVKGEELLSFSVGVELASATFTSP